MTTPTTSIRTGGEIDALCNKCQLNLAHTIIAMVGPKVVKVQCNTCHSLHQYKGTQPLVKAQSFAAPKGKPKTAGTAREPRSKVVITWEERLQGKDIARAKKYSVKDTYVVDDVIDHPTFGLGLVSEVRVDKVEVAFKAFDKTLVHGRGGAPAPAGAAASNAAAAPSTEAKSS